MVLQNKPSNSLWQADVTDAYPSGKSFVTRGGETAAGFFFFPGMRSPQYLVYTPAMPVRSDLSFADSLSSDHRRSFYEGHRSLALLMILIVFLSPFAGLYVASLPGAVVGLLLSFAAFYCTPYLWLKLAG
ncbi:MAG: hypothetical protein ABL970_06585 [Nitrospira sp.]